MISYRTGLGDAARVATAPGAPPEFVAAITKLNQNVAVWPYIEAGEPPLDGLNEFLVKWAAQLGASTIRPIATLIRGQSEYVGQLDAAGPAYADKAKSVRANLRSAGINAQNMVNRIVLLRQTEDPAYATSIWMSDPTSAQYILVNEIPDSKGGPGNVALLAVLESEMGWARSIFAGTPMGASRRTARLTPRQYTRLQMMLWWQSIEQADANIRLAMKGFQMGRENDPPPPVAPTNPTPKNPQGAFALGSTAMGLSLAVVIGWWFMNRRRVESL